MEIRPATVDDVPAVLPMVRKIASMHEQLDPAKYTFRSDPGEMYRGWLNVRPPATASFSLPMPAARRRGLPGFWSARSKPNSRFIASKSSASFTTFGSKRTTGTRGLAASS